MAFLLSSLIACGGEDSRLAHFPNQELVYEDGTYILILRNGEYYFGPTGKSNYDYKFMKVDYLGENCSVLQGFPIVYGASPPVECGPFDIKYRIRNDEIVSYAYCREKSKCNFKDDVVISEIILNDGNISRLSLGTDGPSPMVFLSNR